MADDDKRGFLGRLFGRGRARPQPAPQPAPEPTPASPEDVSPDDAIPEDARPPGAAPEDPAPRALAPEPAEVVAPPPAQTSTEIPAEAPVEARAAAPAAPKRGWLERLTFGLSRTAQSIGGSITDLFGGRKADAATLEDLEDVLIQADLGVAVAGRIVAAVGKRRFEGAVAPEAVRETLAAEVEAVLKPVARPLEVTNAHQPFVILMVGVNGSGKTTTIGKLAAQLTMEGRIVVLAAGDTFRAAAIEQLRVWGDRTGAFVVAKQQGADAAGLVHDAIVEAKTRLADALLIDTAGRLQNKAELMAELEKVIKVIRRADPSAPHAVLLTLDATVGQNALSQVEIFGRTAGVTGLVMTKLDGTARGGILVAIAEKYALPVHFIGVGETLDDLEPFEARDFARAIAGLTPQG
jgi:fused signal recognition particle receptor